MTAFSTGLFAHINYWAVLVASVVAFFLGGLWYSPALFEEVWMNVHGYTPEQVKQIQSNLGVAGFVSTYLGYLVMALAFAVLIKALHLSGLWAGLLLGFILWLGFVATSGLAVNLFSIRPLGAWLIDTGFQLVYLLTTGIILSVWR